MKTHLPISLYESVASGQISSLFSNTLNLSNYSEDYYGDLDLKSIRKSELLAGLQNNDQTRAIASKAAASKSARPAAAAAANHSKEA